MRLRTAVVVTVVLALGLGVGPGARPVRADSAGDHAILDEKGWTAAEATVRARLATDKVDAKEVRRLSWLHLPAFAVTTKDNIAFYAVVAGGKVVLSSDAPSDKRVGAILKAERALARRNLTAADVVFLVHAFGAAPDKIRAAVDNQTTGRGVVPGHDPTLTWSRGKGRLVVWAARTSTRPRPSGAERTPTLHLYKATLTISSSYALRWKVSSVDEAAPAPSNVP